MSEFNEGAPSGFQAPQGPEAAGSAPQPSVSPQQNQAGQGFVDKILEAVKKLFGK